MIVTYLGYSDVNFKNDSGDQIEGTNLWYHLDKSYQQNWHGFQVVKKFIHSDDPIISKVRTLIPGKKVSIDFMSLGKSSVITDIKEVAN